MTSILDVLTAPFFAVVDFALDAPVATTVVAASAIGVVVAALVAIV